MATISWGTGGGGDTALAWAGNSTLSATQIVSAAIELLWAEFVDDDNTLLLYQMDEALWAGVANEIVDGSGRGKHGYRSAGAGTTAAGWQNRYGALSAGTKLTLPSNIINAECAGDFTMEFFVRWNTSGANAYEVFLVDWAAFVGFRFRWNDNWQGATAVALTVDQSTTGTAGNLGTGQYVFGTDWHHVIVTRNGGDFAVYWDGVRGALQTTMSGTNTWGAAGGTSNLLRDGAGAAGVIDLDGARFSNMARYGSGASITPPGRYPASGNVIAGNNTLAGTLTDITWASTETGDNEGDVSAVEVWTGGGWSAVGGASPTSPITGLSLPVTTGNLLRVTMTPKADTLKTETPILTWAKATVTAAVTGGLPLITLPRQQRVGPSLAGLR